MKFRVQVICVQDDRTEVCCDVAELERQQLVMEALGLSVADGKSILHACRSSRRPIRRPKISSAAAIARIVASATGAKRPERTRSTRCSDPWQYPIHGGIVVPVKGKAAHVPANGG